MRLVLLAFSFFVSTLTAQPNSGSDLARIGIISYKDLTGTKRFSYLSKSISQAINDSMKKKFDYVAINPSNLAKALKKYSTKETYSKIEFRKIAAALPAEILIYGYYTFNKESEQIEINNQIYFHEGQHLKSVTTIRNKVDSTIFSATDRVAAEIVKEITYLAIEQAKAEKAKGKKSAENDKLKIRKEIVVSKSGWQGKKNFFTLGIGPHFKLDKTIESNTPSGHFRLKYMRRFVGEFYYGGSIGLFQFEEKDSEEVLTTTVGFAAFSFLGGYNYTLTPKWRLVAQGGGGYFVGSAKSTFISSTEGDSQQVLNETIKNPYALINLGADYLLFKDFFLGLYFGASFLFDQDKSFIRGSIFLNLGYSF